MVAGEVRSPYVPLGNERIDRRHAHSVALAAFFRHAEGADRGDVEHGGRVLPRRPRRPWRGCGRTFRRCPQAITESLRRVLPEDVQRQIGVDTGAWAEELCYLLEDVRDGAGRRMSRSSRSGSSKPSRSRSGHACSVYERTINTLTRQPLIGLLANRNVLPKYGFPTDTVELRTVYSGDPVGRKLDLSRDLSAAIYEYAPGAEVVAGGRLWTSGGVYRLPERELIGNHYAVCTECSLYRERRRRPGPGLPVLRNGAEGRRGEATGRRCSGSWPRAT